MITKEYLLTLDLLSLKEWKQDLTCQRYELQNKITYPTDGIDMKTYHQRCMNRIIQELDLLVDVIEYLSLTDNRNT